MDLNPDNPKSKQPAKSSDRKHKRVTLNDVGRKCGYHGSTVGLALRNHPGIPEATRNKIRVVADEMGYRPDPALSALVAHRYGLSEGKGFSTIAILSDHPCTTDWRVSNPVGAEYYQGMVKRSTDLGYKVEEFNVGPKHEGERSIDRILKARGINTVIIAPLYNLDLPINLDWNAYSAVALGYSLISPPLPRITHQHRDGTQTAVLELIRLGYRRIAFLNPYDNEVRVGYGYSAGFFSIVGLHADKVEGLPNIPKHYSNLGCQESVDWLKKYNPEVVIASQSHILAYLREQGFRIPEELGFVKLGVDLNSDPAAQVSGIYENSVTIGEEAVNLVAQMQSAHFRGVPPIRQVHLVQGKWISGTTVRRVGDSLL